MRDHEQFTIADLQRMCDEHDNESITLEFKPCNELKAGSPFRDRDGSQRPREREELLDELTRDVTAFLNSAGGTIIYGIQGKTDRAVQIDRANAFQVTSQQDNVKAEKVIQWLRAYIQPSPTVDVYPVFEVPGNSRSPWYLVVEIPQGLVAYMARDHRFYKRVGASVQLMEQYEVVDVMNRTRAAALDVRLSVNVYSQSSDPKVGFDLSLKTAVTSNNFIASEYGAIKLTAAYPLRLVNDSTQMIFRGAQFERSVGLPLGGEEIPHAESMMVRWGANAGIVIFPGHWHDFYGNSISISVPDLSAFSIVSTHLLQVELFTMNSSGNKRLFAIERQVSSNEFEISEVDPLAREVVVSSFWQTYHSAMAMETK